MGANKWARCPKCLKNEAEKRYKALDEITKKYGKIENNEYMQLGKAAIDKFPSNREELQEYHQATISSSGELHLLYSCACKDCGFKYKFTVTTQIPWGDEK